MYGAHFPRLSYDEAPLGYGIGKNSEVITKGDILTNSSGFIAVNTGNDVPVGIANQDGTMTGTNQTVAKVEVPYIPAETDMTFEMDLDSAETAAYQGYLYTLTGATGAMKVDQSSHSLTVGVVELVKLDPRKEGSTTRGLFRFARSQKGFTVAT